MKKDVFIGINELKQIISAYRNATILELRVGKYGVFVDIEDEGIVPEKKGNVEVMKSDKI